MASGGIALSFERRVIAFWVKVNKDGPVPPNHPEMTNCWIWEGCKNHRNYGTFHIGFHALGKQRNMKAHHVAFFLIHGYWPVEIDHKCHVTLCVRPDHIRDVTHKENMHNLVRKVCVRGHALVEENFMYSSGGKRRCRPCYEELLTRQRAERLARGHMKKGRKAKETA